MLACTIFSVIHKHHHYKHSSQGDYNSVVPDAYHDKIKIPLHALTPGAYKGKERSTASKHKFRQLTGRQVFTSCQLM